jgi:dephospho-CoA kinase
VTRTESGRSTPVIGVLGAIASGKSTVAELLARRGAVVIDADRIGHQVLERPDVRERLRAEFGDTIFSDGDRVDRTRLAAAAFAGPGRSAVLDGITHPFIIEEIEAQVAEARGRCDAPLIVLDAALLMETRLDRELCQALLFVAAPDQVRLQRAAERQGMGPDQLAARASAQLPVSHKAQAADFVIDNSRSVQELDQQVGRLWPELCATTLPAE